MHMHYDSWRDKAIGRTEKDPEPWRDNIDAGSERRAQLSLLMGDTGVAERSRPCCSAEIGLPGGEQVSLESRSSPKDGCRLTRVHTKFRTRRVATSITSMIVESIYSIFIVILGVLLRSLRRTCMLALIIVFGE